MARRRLFVADSVRGARRVGHGLRRIGTGIKNVNRFAEKSGVNMDLLKKAAKIADVMDKPLGEGLKFLDNLEVARQNPSKVPKSSPTVFPGTGGITTLYKSAEVAKISINGAGKPIKSENLSRHRHVLNGTWNLTGPTTGRAFNQVIFTPTTRADLLTASDSLFPSDATQRYTMQIANMTNRFMFHNMDRVTAFMDFYVVTPAEDTDLSVASALNNSANAARYTVSTGTVSADDVDFNVANSYFKKYYTILSHKSFKMEPGKTLQLLVQQDGFFPIDEARLVAGTSTANIKGQNIQFVVRAYTAPIRDGADGGVSIGTVDIIATQTTIINYQGLTLRSYSRREVGEFTDEVITTENVKSAVTDAILASPPTGNNVDTTVDVDP